MVGSVQLIAIWVSIWHVAAMCAGAVVAWRAVRAMRRDARRCEFDQRMEGLHQSFLQAATAYGAAHHANIKRLYKAHDVAEPGVWLSDDGNLKAEPRAQRHRPRDLQDFVVATDSAYRLHWETGPVGLTTANWTRGLTS